MAIHEEVLKAAARLCFESGEKAFRVADVVRALPHLNSSSVRTHVVSRCCVNAPKNHPHKWDYFRRVGRGEYEILPLYRKQRAARNRVEEQTALYAKASPVRDTIHVVVRRSTGIYVAEGLEIAVVTQGRSLDELLTNLREAIRLHLEGEDPAALGLSARPRIAIVYEEPVLDDAEA